MSTPNVLGDFLTASGAKPPRNIAHIGAHLGEEAGYYEDLGAEMVVWVEANPDMYERLRNTISTRPGSHTEHVFVNALIADVDGEQRELYLAGQDGEASSLMRQTDELKQRMPWVAETGKVVRAPTYTIDTVMREVGIPVGALDTLILDTQGAELICLKGLDVYSDGICYLLSEGTTSAYFDGGVLFGELRQTLEARGFLYVPMGVNTASKGLHYDFMFLQNPEGGARFNDAQTDSSLRAAANELVLQHNEHALLDGAARDEARIELEAVITSFAETRGAEIGARNAREVIALLLDISWLADCKDSWRTLLRHSGYIETANAPGT